MILTAILGVQAGLIDTPKAVVGAIPSLEPNVRCGVNALRRYFTVQMVIVIITFFFIDFFDTAGTLVAVCESSWINEEQ